MVKSFLQPMRFLLPALLFIFAACQSRPEPFGSKRLVIAAKETVKLSQIDLTLTNNGCGREWGDGFERAFCDLVIKTKDSTVHLSNSSKPLYLGLLRIEIDRMNPWGKEEDSIPPGGCRVVVTRLPDNSR